jgi:hypothetical protein
MTDCIQSFCKIIFHEYCELLKVVTVGIALYPVTLSVSLVNKN